MAHARPGDVTLDLRALGYRDGVLDYSSACGRYRVRVEQLGANVLRVTPRGYMDSRAARAECEMLVRLLDIAGGHAD